jgi:hypothetical protein
VSGILLLDCFNQNVFDFSVVNRDQVVYFRFDFDFYVFGFDDYFPCCLDEWQDEFEIRLDFFSAHLVARFDSVQRSKQTDSCPDRQTHKRPWMSQLLNFRFFH